MSKNDCRTAWCSTCKKFLPIVEFRKNSMRKSGVGSSCKSCERKRENSVNGKYKSYRRNAKQRGLEFSISKDEFLNLIIGECRYCGKRGEPYNGVDRVDNEKGYVAGNCVPCCEWCNKIKMNYSIEETKEHIRKMYEYMNLK